MVVEANGTDGSCGVASPAGLGTRRILAQQATASLLIDVHLSYFQALQFDLIVVQRLDDGQRLDALHASLNQHLAPALKLLFYDKAHANNLGTCLSAEVDNAQPGITEGQEVVDEQHAVVGLQILATDDERVILLLGE